MTIRVTGEFTALNMRDLVLAFKQICWCEDLMDGVQGSISNGLEGDKNTSIPCIYRKLERYACPHHFPEIDVS